MTQQRTRRVPGEERRAQIIAAAQELFARHGYDGTRTKEIAERAGTREGVLYRHFESKEQLFDAAVLEPLTEWLDDEYYRVPRRRLHPKPVQRPHPPMWMACTQPDSWALAGSIGAGVLAFGFASPGELEQAIRAYREASEHATTPYGVVNNQVAFAPPMFCAQDEREALGTAAPAILFFMECDFRYVLQWQDTDAEDYAFYRKIGTDILKLPELTDEEKEGLSPQAAMIKAGVKAGLFRVGTPDQCREFVRGYRAQGVDQMLMICQLGALTNDQIQGSMKLFGAEVLPEFSSTLTGTVARCGGERASVR